MDTASEAEDFDAWMAYRKAKRAKKGAQGSGEHGSREKNKPSGEGRTKHVPNRRTRVRNRCYARNRKYRNAPQCPQTENRHGGKGKNPPRKPYSSIAKESPNEVGSPGKSAPLGPARSHEKSFPRTPELGGQFVVTQSDSVVVLNTGATANLVCCKWLGNRN